MRFDAIGRRGLYLLPKCTTSIRMLSYILPIDNFDEYV